jgi:hypothetical protein
MDSVGIRHVHLLVADHDRAIASTAASTHQGWPSAYVKDTDGYTIEI